RCRSCPHRRATGAVEREEVLVPAGLERAEEVEADLLDLVEPAAVDFDYPVVVATGRDRGRTVGDAGLPQERAHRGTVTVEVDLEVRDEVPEGGQPAVGESREEGAHLLLPARVGQAVELAVVGEQVHERVPVAVVEVAAVLRVELPDRLEVFEAGDAVEQGRLGGGTG